jgi:hypothetical protein
MFIVEASLMVIVSYNGIMSMEQVTGIKYKNNSEYHVWPFLINNKRQNVSEQINIS